MVDENARPPSRRRAASRPRSEEPPRATPRWIRYGQGGALVFEFTGTVAAGALVGYALDRQLGTDPAFLLTLSILGVVGGFARLLQILKRLDRRP